MGSLVKQVSSISSSIIFASKTHFRVTEVLPKRRIYSSRFAPPRLFNIEDMKRRNQITYRPVSKTTTRNLTEKMLLKNAKRFHHANITGEKPAVKLDFRNTDVLFRNLKSFRSSSSISGTFNANNGRQNFVDVVPEYKARIFAQSDVVFRQPARNVEVKADLQPEVGDSSSRSSSTTNFLRSTITFEKAHTPRNKDSNPSIVRVSDLLIGKKRQELEEKRRLVENKNKIRSVRLNGKLFCQNKADLDICGTWSCSVKKKMTPKSAKIKKDVF